MRPETTCRSLVAAIVWLTGHASVVYAQTLLGRESADASSQYLRQVMDQFHNRFPVYDDVSSAGNHFHAWAIIGDNPAAVTMNGSWTDRPHSGATAIRCSFHRLTDTNYGGFYMQNGVLPPGATSPQNNFGTIPAAGINLDGSTALTFWARGERGGELVEFFLAGVGRDPQTGAPTEPFSDSSPRYPRLGTTMLLTRDWQKFTLDLSGLNLSYVLGGFAWVCNAVNNPAGAVFFLDDIQFELDAKSQQERLSEPRFLVSYRTEPVQSLPDPIGDFDLRFRNTAFLYDNALALLAFLAEGSADGVRRAELIGRAMIYAQDHDRSYDNGQLRSAYAGGDFVLPPGWTPNGRSETVAVPGFYDETSRQFFEVEQSAIDTGNNAWAMIALLALHRQTGSDEYLGAARRIGDRILGFRGDSGTYRGFLGGITMPESPNPTPRVYASVEHNLDVFAAFTRMFEVTGEPQWSEEAEHARTFIEAMWDADRLLYLAGTVDPNTRNTMTGQLPLDVQAWSVLALPDELETHPGLLARIAQTHGVTCAQFSGFDFNDDRDGLWFEGAAHVATALAHNDDCVAAESYRSTLRSAQQQSPWGDGFGIAAACEDSITSGFGFHLFRRLHVAATAWNVFAQREWNPYYQSSLARGTVAFVDDAVSISEDQRSVTIRARRTDGSHGAIAADVAFVGGTATPGIDYSDAPIRLEWDDGEVDERSAVIMLASEDGCEDAETIELSLKSASECSPIGAPAEMSVTIADSDGAGLGDLVQFVMPAENDIQVGGHVEVYLERTGQESGTVTVRVTANNGELEGVTVSPDELVWRDERGEKPVTVSIRADSALRDQEPITLRISATGCASADQQAELILRVRHAVSESENGGNGNGDRVPPINENTNGSGNGGNGDTNGPDDIGRSSPGCGADLCTPAAIVICALPLAGLFGKHGPRRRA